MGAHQSVAFDKARAAILDAIEPVEREERVAIQAALGRVLSEDVIAPFDVPAHDNSAMDGFAVRHSDLLLTGETSLNVVGTALAGHEFKAAVGVNQAVRIMTGAVLPSGADCVVVLEDVKVSGGEGEGASVVAVPAGQCLYQHIRRAGEDLARGMPALRSGKRLGPADIGLLASMGKAEVAVRQAVRVALFSTGDELASIGQTLTPGAVFDSNRYTLGANLARLGAIEVVDMGVVRDDADALEDALIRAAGQADVIITTGGVSVGDADFIKPLMARLGRVDFWKIAVKPGRPMAFGRVGNVLLFGLPGNPVAVMVSFHQFVADALLKLMGVSPLPVRPTFRVRCQDAVEKRPGRREFLRGVLAHVGGEWRVSLFGNQGSGVLRSMSEANCYVVLDETQGSVSPDDWVEVQMFEGIL